MNLRTRGRRGSKNPKIFADVINGSPLMCPWMYHVKNLYCQAYIITRSCVMLLRLHLSKWVWAFTPGAVHLVKKQPSCYGPPRGYCFCLQWSTSSMSMAIPDSRGDSGATPSAADIASPRWTGRKEARKVCIKSPWTVVRFSQIVYFISDYQRLSKQLPKLVKLQKFYSMMSCLMNVD